MPDCPHRDAATLPGHMVYASKLTSGFVIGPTYEEQGNIETRVER